MKILIVDDEPLILLALKMDLEDAGHSVFEAPNADVAVEFLGIETVELIITDVDMPGSMDGLKLAAAVRDRWPPVKIIVMSGKQRPAIGQLPQGSRFLAKPFNARELVSLLASI